MTDLTGSERAGGPGGRRRRRRGPRPDPLLLAEDEGGPDMGDWRPGLPGAAAAPVFRSPPPRPTLLRGALTMLGLIYHATVRDVRKGHRNAAAGLLLNILQTVIFIATFYLMFWLLGVSGNRVRGDFLLYLMSGIFLFMIHTKAVGAIVRAEGPTSPMMQHAPLNTTITMAASALSALYLQVLSMMVILGLYHVLWTPLEIEEPMGAIGMVLVAWISGVGVGICFAALRPWYPEFTSVGSSIYSRANMVASGKMFVANSLPASMLPIFDWNPLFHAIDQARGYVFLNYSPHFSSWPYALWVAFALIVIGLMGEAYTRRHASLSWSAGR